MAGLTRWAAGAADGVAGASPAGGLPAWLNRNLLIRFSSTIASCTNSIVIAVLEDCSEPPGEMPTYCPPSRPDVRMLASLSFGIAL